jgi:hypothetical protein
MSDKRATKTSCVLPFTLASHAGVSVAAVHGGRDGAGWLAAAMYVDSFAEMQQHEAELGRYLKQQGTEDGVLIHDNCATSCESLDDLDIGLFGLVNIYKLIHFPAHAHTVTDATGNAGGRGVRFLLTAELTLRYP